MLAFLRGHQRPPEQSPRNPANIVMVSLTSRCDYCRYIYNHKRCGRCGTSVRTWDMSARTCYACEVCQPLQKGTILDTKRSKALSAAKDSKVSPILRLSCMISTALLLVTLCNHLFCSRTPALTAKSSFSRHASDMCMSFPGTLVTVLVELHDGLICSSGPMRISALVTALHWRSQS